MSIKRYVKNSYNWIEVGRRAMTIMEHSLLGCLWSFMLSIYKTIITLDFDFIRKFDGRNNQDRI